MEVHRKFVCTTPATKDKTFQFRDFKFVDGVYETILPEPQMDKLTKYLYANLQAVPEDQLDGVHASEEDRADGSVPSVDGDGARGEGETEGGAGSEADGDGHGDAETGEAGSVPEGDGPGAEVPLNKALLAAVKSLDPDNDDHWTKLGKPSMSAVEAAYGSAGITRSDVEAVAPDYDRDAARNEKEEDE